MRTHTKESQEKITPQKALELSLNESIVLKTSKKGVRNLLFFTL